MIGNEGAIPSGSVESVYEPHNEFKDNERQWLPVEDVQWITTLRHPYSRTLSHYHHAIRNKFQANLTLEEFLTQPYGIGFHKFIPNHMTRWHCGTGPCVRSDKPLTAAELQHAMDNLQKMTAVLILEDFSHPESCTRRQMRHVLKLEAFDDTNKTSNTTPPLQDAPAEHRSDTNWETAIRPYLNDEGSSTNHWSMRPEQVAGNFTNTTTNNTTAQQQSTTKLMAALGVHNDYDLQLYGYARHLCEALADQYDRQAEEAANATTVTTEEENVVTTAHQGLFAWNSDEMLSISMPVFFGPASSSSISSDHNHPLPPSYQQLSNSFPLMMYALFILVFVVLSQQRRQRQHKVVTFRL